METSLKQIKERYYKKIALYISNKPQSFCYDSISKIITYCLSISKTPTKDCMSALKLIDQYEKESITKKEYKKNINRLIKESKKTSGVTHDFYWSIVYALTSHNKKTNFIYSVLFILKIIVCNLELEEVDKIVENILNGEYSQNKN